MSDLAPSRPLGPRPLTMAVTRARTNLVDQLRRRPGRTLVVALGTGYLLGGGLATKMTGSLLATVGRVTLRLAIVPLFLDALERNLFGDRASDEADGLTKRPTV